MNFPLPSTVVAAILGDYGPLSKINAHWPLVEAALDAAGIYSPLCAVAAIATIAVETGRFGPIKERGGPTYLANVYENRKDLGNVNPGDGAKFQGRGFIPIVGRREYERFGKEIGKDLAGNPDLALDPPIAAELLAAYFKERDVRTFADQENWEMVRRRVSAIVDRTEWPRFLDIATQLVSALKNPPPSTASVSQQSAEELDQ
jgi:predicted chitinase